VKGGLPRKLVGHRYAASEAKSQSRKGRQSAGPKIAGEEKGESGGGTRLWTNGHESVGA